MTTRSAPFWLVIIVTWLYSRLENLAQHLLQLMVQTLVLLLKLMVFLPQLFNLSLSQAHHPLHFVDPLI
ncbi:MAG: hypothetical protein DDT27_00566 [Dehalococcoidia bacterium]|nr:hypothetical protein [Chloroflexota bacterium]